MDLHIKDVLKKYVKNSEIEDGYYAQKISNYWFSKMGQSISTRTDRVLYRNSELIIYVNSAPLKQELFNSRPKIMSLINEFLGEDLVQKVTLY